MKKELTPNELLDLFFDCQELLWSAYEALEDKLVFEAYFQTSKIYSEMKDWMYRDTQVTVH